MKSFQSLLCLCCAKWHRHTPKVFGTSNAPSYYYIYSKQQRKQPNLTLFSPNIPIFPHAIKYASAVCNYINLIPRRRMRKLLHEKRQEGRRSSTIAKSQLSTHVDQTFKYYIGCGNNGELVRRVLSTRPQWAQTTDSKQLFINLKWQQGNKTYKYENCIDNRIFKHSLNHFQYHHELSNKEYLFKNVVDYCENHKINAFQFIPLTFVLNLVDSNYESQQAHFLSFYHSFREGGSQNDIETLHLRRRRGNPNHMLPIDKSNHSRYCKYEIRPSFKSQPSPYLWILKPTSYNRGNGVHVFNTLLQLETLMNRYIQGITPLPLTQSVKVSTDSVLKRSFRIRESTSNFSIRSSSFVIQKYMQKPLLFSGRKFDIRMWVLFTHQLKVYIFKQGYLRTSSYQFNLSTDNVSNPNIHLTNNAVQKYNQDYGRYELGNQLSFQYLKTLVNQNNKSYPQLMAMIKAIVKITALSVRKKLNKQERNYCFEIYGYDFMLDDQCNPWLIEVNTNPCIEQSSPILQELLPRMLDDAFTLTIDKIFGSKKHHSHFHVQGEQNCDNLWEYIVDLKKN